MKYGIVAVVAGMSAAAIMCGCTSTAERLTEKANLGDTAAQWQLADLMMTGREGAPCNPPEAKRWIEKSIQGENIDALALKGEFEAEGRYGQVPVTTALDHLYPAIKQNRNSRAAFQYLKAAIKANDVDHIPQCTEAIGVIFEGPKEYRQQASLFLYGALRGWVKTALNVRGQRYAVQTARVLAMEKFINIGWTYTHHQRRELEDYQCDRVSVMMGQMKTDVAKARKLLERTCEVEGRGISAKECIADAQRKAASTLTGVKIGGGEKVENTEQTINNKTEQKDKFSSNIEAQYAGVLESFEIVEAPHRVDNGDYVCVALAVGKPDAAKK